MTIKLPIRLGYARSLITALSLNGGPRNLKSANKATVPPEQSPGFAERKIEIDVINIGSNNVDLEALGDEHFKQSDV